MRHDSEHVIELGYQGETAVMEELLRRGHNVKSGVVNGEDLIIDNVCAVEVKTAELSGSKGNRQGRWQFCLYPHPGRDKPFDEDLLILRCESHPPVHFIIPGMCITRALTKIDITSEDPRRYQGIWSIFRERWDLIDHVIDLLVRNVEDY